jgi:Protein of unknown function (DUF3800)
LTGTSRGFLANAFRVALNRSSEPSACAFTGGFAELLDLEFLMSRLYFFADEAGCFNFSRKPGASRYFIVCTIVCPSCGDLGSELLALRRELVWERTPVGEYFHATEDKQVIRDRVFALLRKHKFSVQATIMEKSKAYPRVKVTNHMFYQYGWYYHFQHIVPKLIAKGDELHITTASVGTQKGQAVFSTAVNNVVQQVLRASDRHRTNFCRSIADPCLQAADYCTWAIQKKWEAGDLRSYELIKDRINHEIDMWSHGNVHQY